MSSEITPHRKGVNVSHLEAGSQEVKSKVLSTKLGKNGLPLEPKPMNDANDPLNWSAAKKILILLVVSAWVCLGTLNMIIAGPTFYPVAAELKTDFSLMTYLVGGPLLAYGVASLIWVAFANRHGVRFSFVATTFISASLGIWGAKATTFSQLVAARSLASVFYASPETLAPQVVADVFFLKDRSKAMALVLSMQATGFAMGPLVGSFVTHNLGWRWTQWLMTILTYTICACILLFVPETQYTADPKFMKDKRRVMQNWLFTRVSGGGQAKVHSFTAAFLGPFRYARHPLVLLVTAYFSIYLMATNYILTTQSISYTIVYRLSVEDGGLTYFAALLGCWTGMIYCGAFQDIILARKAKAEAYQPEQRLPFLIVALVLGTAGTALFGAATQAELHWFVPLIGTFGNLFGFITATSIATAYLVDVYLARSDAVLVILNGFKNFAAFGISYAIIPWNMGSGYAIPFGILAAILGASHGIMLLLWWKGEYVRAWTAKRFVEARATHHGEVF